MERPENCPDILYAMMRQTWCHKATRRPTFIDIARELMLEIDTADFEKVSFYHSPDGVEVRNQNPPSQYRTEKLVVFNSKNATLEFLDSKMKTLCFSSLNRELEMVMQESREEEAEGEEDSPLRQDFGDFSSFEPMARRKNGSSGHFGMEPFTDNSKSPTSLALGFLDLNSSKAPLKAGFDDFDGVSAGSLASSKDTLNLPFAEDSVKPVKNSPFAQKKSSSKGNVSQSSAGKSSLSPQSPSIIATTCNLGLFEL